MRCGSTSALENSRAPRNWSTTTRERKIACVVFSVDETLTGRQQVPNDDVLSLAAANPDVMIPFASVQPDARGQKRSPKPGG